MPTSRIGRHGTPSPDAADTTVRSPRSSGAKAAASGTTARQASSHRSRWAVASVSADPTTPPRVHAPWKDGRIGRAYRCSSATACMLVVASTAPSEMPYTAIPTRNGASDPDSPRKGRATAMPRSEARSIVALLRLAAPFSATSDPTAASSTIISSTRLVATSPRSYSSVMSGRRVVRLMNTKPWVKKAPAAARRDVLRPSTNRMLTDSAHERRAFLGAVAGPARRDRVEPGREAHLDHRPPVDRGGRGRRPVTGAAAHRALRPGADQPTPARPPYGGAGRARGGRSGRRPRRVVLRRLRGPHDRAGPRGGPRLDRLEPPLPRRRVRRPGGGPARPRGRALPGGGARPGLRARAR